MAPAEPPKLEDVIRNVIASVATAIGVIGLLAAVGGAVTWLRVTQVGIPTQTALSVTPKHDLIALGATGLVIFVGLAVLIVAALFALDPKGHGEGPTVWTALFLVVGALYYVVRVADFDGRSERILIATVIALAICCVRIARATGERFVPFGVTVFFAVLLFGAVVTYRAESDHPRVQPAAVLRGDERTGLVGFFVAATDDRIYIARLTRESRPGALYDFKRDDKTRLAVGRRIRCESGRGKAVKCVAAGKAAIGLRRQLLADRRKTATPPTKAKKKPKQKAGKSD
jgi:hypothetical protein